MDENSAFNHDALISSSQRRDIRRNKTHLAPNDGESAISWVLSEIAVRRTSVWVRSDCQKQQIYPTISVAIVAGEINDPVQGCKGLLDDGLNYGR